MSSFLKTSWVSSFPRITGVKFFSTTNYNSREFAHVVRRKVRQPREVNVNDPDTLLPSTPPKFPPYPYGPSLIYKQSNRGLYGGKYPQFGHKISEKFNQKSMRVFHPNVQRTVLYSDVLKKSLRIRLVTSVLRTITKEGGLDNYLTKDTPARIKELGPFGWNLRYTVLMKQKEHERTQAKPLEGLIVGKARLIKDLFMNGGQKEGETFKEFRMRLVNASPDELLTSLESHGVDVSKYRTA